MRGRRGFTLVEMLVVILIISLLAALLTVMFDKIVTSNRYAATSTLVHELDLQCKAYKMEYGVYPPDDKGDSRCLHYHLGRPRVLTLAGGATSTRPALLEFRDRWLQTTGPADPENPSPLIDAWGNLIRYRVTPEGFQIWSPGKNGVDELDPKHPKFDDVTNWVRDW